MGDRIMDEYGKALEKNTFGEGVAKVAEMVRKRLAEQNTTLLNSELEAQKSEKDAVKELMKEAFQEVISGGATLNKTVSTMGPSQDILNPVPKDVTTPETDITPENIKKALFPKKDGSLEKYSIKPLTAEERANAKSKETKPDNKWEDVLKLVELGQKIKKGALGIGFNSPKGETFQSQINKAKDIGALKNVVKSYADLGEYDRGVLNQLADLKATAIKLGINIDISELSGVSAAPGAASTDKSIDINAAAAKIKKGGKDRNGKWINSASVIAEYPGITQEDVNKISMALNASD